MVQTRMVIPFPVWDAIAKHDEISKFMHDEMGAKYFPFGTPRKIEFKNIPLDNTMPEVPREELVDRIQVKLWYPGGGYITLIISGYESEHPEWGTGWHLDGYQAKWKDFSISGHGSVNCQVKFKGEIARFIGNICHWRLNKNNVLNPDDIEIVKENMSIETLS